MEKIKLILVDDHRLVRAGIKSLLNDNDRFEILGEAENGDELIVLLQKELPNVILLDISLPGLSGIDWTRKILETSAYNGVKILILSMFTQEEFIFNAIQAGAKGYLPKNTSKKELLEAIEAVHKGEEYFSQQISGIILKSYIKKAQNQEDESKKKEDLLSKREIEILKLFAEGVSNQEIADKLFISVRTVESHKNHIMQKLELKNTVDLVKFAIKNKIIEL
jgi:two-component system response regulator NreC